MLKIEYHSQFKKDYKLAVKRGLDVSLLTQVISMLANGETLPPNLKITDLRTQRNIKM